jgi:hypothetical protein
MANMISFDAIKYQERPFNLSKRTAVLDALARLTDELDLNL